MAPLRDYHQFTEMSFFLKILLCLYELAQWINPREQWLEPPGSDQIHDPFGLLSGSHHGSLVVLLISKNDAVDAKRLQRFLLVFPNDGDHLCTAQQSQLYASGSDAARSAANKTVSSAVTTARFSMCSAVRYEVMKVARFRQKARALAEAGWCS